MEHLRWDMFIMDPVLLIAPRRCASQACITRELNNWQLRLYPTDYFILEKCGPNPWVSLPGFALERIWEDYLHVVDLALSPDACASAA